MLKHVLSSETLLAEASVRVSGEGPLAFDVEGSRAILVVGWGFSLTGIFWAVFSFLWFFTACIWTSFEYWIHQTVWAKQYWVPREYLKPKTILADNGRVLFEHIQPHILFIK